jgi:hypothetical protein
MTLTPAYGRDYKSAKAAKEDFNADKDFIIADISSPYDGRPVNKSQLPKGTSVTLRFKRQTQVAVVKV